MTVPAALSEVRVGVGVRSMSKSVHRTSISASRRWAALQVHLVRRRLGTCHSVEAIHRRQRSLLERSP